MAQADNAVIGEQPLDAEGKKIVQQLLEFTERAVIEGVDGLPESGAINSRSVKTGRCLAAK